MKPNEQTHTYPGIVINADLSTEGTTGMQLEYEGITYQVSNINLLLEEEKAKLIEGIKNTHNLFADEYQKFYGVGIDQNTLGIIDILPDKSIKISYETPDQEFPTLNAEIGATVNYFDVLLRDDSLNPLEESQAKVTPDVDGSDHSEEPAIDEEEHQVPDQHQVTEAEGGDNTDAPSFFSTFFSTIGDFFSSIFSSIFSFIFGSDSEENDAATSTSDESESEVEEWAIGENPVSNSLDSNSQEGKIGQQLPQNGAPNHESDAPESEAGEEQIIVGDHSQEPDDSTFSISSIFSTIGSYLGLSKIGSYLGLSKMGSYLSSIFSSDEGKEDSQQLQNGENLQPHPSHSDVHVENPYVPSGDDISGI